MSSQVGKNGQSHSRLRETRTGKRESGQSHSKMRSGPTKTGIRSPRAQRVSQAERQQAVAVCKPRGEAWSRSGPPGPQRRPTLPALPPSRPVRRSSSVLQAT